MHPTMLQKVIVPSLSLPDITIGIQLFVECLALCRVFFVGHSTKNSLPSAILGKSHSR
jgi:hypothetical protein